MPCDGEQSKERSALKSKTGCILAALCEAPVLLTCACHKHEQNACSRAVSACLQLDGHRLLCLPPFHSPEVDVGEGAVFYQGPCNQGQPLPPQLAAPE
jgi:hypothetical protein